MKKILALILAAMMIFAVVSCGNNTDAGKDTDSDTDAVVDTNDTADGTDTETPDTDTEVVDTDADTDATDTDATDTGAVGTDAEGADTEAEGGEISGETTWGQTLLGVFNDTIAANPEISAFDLANTIITHESILFFGGATPMEAGAEWLPGFDTAPTGWTECVNFGPMMGSIAFVGYIFTLEDGADVDAFKQSLSDNCNPRWQICVTADETIVENVGNTVFFLMSPFSNSGEAEAEGGDL